MNLFNRWLAVLLKPWVMVSYALVIVLAYLYLDRPLAIYLHSLHLKIKFPIIYWVTCLGITQIYVVLLLAIALVYRYIIHNKTAERRAWFLWFCLLIPAIVGLVLKMILGRARPELLFDHQLFGFYGWHTQKAYFSFPSGHVTAITSLLIGLVILFPRYYHTCIVVGLLVITTRILLASHYLSDILASMYLVFLELGLVFYIIQRRYPKVWGLVFK